jgi:hypothetical protein
LNSKLNKELEKLKQEEIDIEKKGLLKPINEDTLVWAEFKKRLPKELRAMGYKDVKTFDDAIKTIKERGADLMNVAQRLLSNIKLEVREGIEKSLGIGDDVSKKTKFEEIEKQLFV